MRLVFRHNIETYGFERRLMELAPKAGLAAGQDLTALVTDAKHLPMTEEFCEEFLAAVCDAPVEKGEGRATAIKFLRSFTNINELSADVGRFLAGAVRTFRVFHDRRQAMLCEMAAEFAAATQFRGQVGRWPLRYRRLLLDGESLEVARKANFKTIPRRYDKYPILVKDLKTWEAEFAASP